MQLKNYAMAHHGTIFISNICKCPHFVNVWIKKQIVLYASLVNAPIGMFAKYLKTTYRSLQLIDLKKLITLACKARV
jgi:hypothetical protein